MKNLLFIAATAFLALSLNSCGTILNAKKKGKTEVFLIDAPAGLSVSSNGENLSIESDIFAATGKEHGAIEYHTNCVRLPRKKKATITLSAGGKTATVALKPKVWGKIVVVDALLTAGIGWWVDIPTGNILTLKPRLIDVPAALAGKPKSQWRSQGKLKRQEKRRIKKG